MSPDHCTVNFVEGVGQSEGSEWLWIARLKIVGAKNVILPANEEDNSLVRPLVDRVHMVNVLRQVEQSRYLRWIALVQPLISNPPQILFEKQKTRTLFFCKLFIK